MSAIAPKSYSSGEIIVISEPLVHVLNSQFKGFYCDNCFVENESLKKCSHCKNMYYCHRKCQQNDWKCHKLECDIYYKYNCFQNENYYERQWLMIDNNSLWRILMRLWLLIQSDQSIALKKYICHDGQQRCLIDLISHANDIKNDKPRMLWFSQICDKFRSFGIEVCEEKLLRLFGQFSVNHFECKNYNEKNSEYSINFLGFGLYINISIFNHSCQPNAAYINYGNKIQIRAIKPIAANEQIFIDYMPLERSKMERRFILQNNWYFYCMCVKCESDFDDTINYKALKSLVQFSDKTIEHDFPSDHQLLVLKQVYNGYHPAYSFYLLINLLKRVNHYHNHNVDDHKDFENYLKSAQNVKELILLTFENLTVTNGREHETFALFEKIVLKYGLNNLK